MNLKELGNCVWFTQKYQVLVNLIQIVKDKRTEAHNEEKSNSMNSGMCTVALRSVGNRIQTDSESRNAIFKCW